MKTTTICEATYAALVDLLQTQITTAEEDAATAAAVFNSEECERNHALADAFRFALRDLTTDVVDLGGVA